VSLSLTWFEHDDGVRVDDSLGDEVEAYFGSDAEILLDHRAFGPSFQVDTAIFTEFEYSDREITSWTYNTYRLPLKQVLNVLTLRRQILDSVSQKLQRQLATAVQSILDPTKLSALSGDLLNGSLDLEEPIMIHYLNYVLPRFDAEMRIDPNFYRGGLRGFEEYLFTKNVA
jgi:hypothetical protein